MAKMKVKMLVSIGGPEWSAAAGDEVDMTADECVRLCMNGLAEPADSASKKVVDSALEAKAKEDAAALKKAAAKAKEDAKAESAPETAATG